VRKKKEQRRIWRKGDEGEKGRSKGNVLGERERKVRKEGTKEMDWEKWRGRAKGKWGREQKKLIGRRGKEVDWEKGRGR
jgi:hypothetical protein